MIESSQAQDSELEAIHHYQRNSWIKLEEDDEGSHSRLVFLEAPRSRPTKASKWEVWVWSVIFGAAIVLVWETLNVFVDVAPIYIEAWQRWLAGEQVTDVHLLWWSILWWGRVGKILGLVAVGAFIAEIIGKEGLKNIWKALAAIGIHNPIQAPILKFYGLFTREVARGANGKRPTKSWQVMVFLVDLVFGFGGALVLYNLSGWGIWAGGSAVGSCKGRSRQGAGGSRG